MHLNTEIKEASVYGFQGCGKIRVKMGAKIKENNNHLLINSEDFLKALSNSSMELLSAS